MTMPSFAMRAARRALFALALCCSVVASTVAMAQLPVPALSGRVVDQTGTLKPEQKAALEQTLQAFEARKGSQLAVLIVPTTAPEAIEPFSLRVVEQWKLGRKKVDDGALLLLAKEDRALRIEVGYGLEGALNDATAKRIISETIAPYFRQQDFYGGIAAGVEQIIRVVDGEPLPAPRNQSVQRSGNQPDAGGDIGQYAPVLFILAMVAGGILRAMFGRLPGAVLTGGAVALLAWFLIGAVSIALIAGVIALVATLMGGLGGRGLGGFSGGGFGGGGGSSGGFSGGGGGFGGGGASGKW